MGEGGKPCLRFEYWSGANDGSALAAAPDLELKLELSCCLPWLGMAHRRGDTWLVECGGDHWVRRRESTGETLLCGSGRDHAACSLPSAAPHNLPHLPLPSAPGLAPPLLTCLGPELLLLLLPGWGGLARADTTVCPRAGARAGKSSRKYMLG